MNDQTARGAGAKIIVRPVDEADLRGLYEIVHHPQVARSLLQLPSMEFGETERWLRDKQPGHHRLVAVQNGRVAGSVSIFHAQRPRLQHSAQLGLMVHPDFWGQRVGTTLMQAAVELADTWLNIRRLELAVLAHNDVAGHLYERFGFELEGTQRDAVYGDGAYQDQHIMARLHNVPLRSEQAPPPQFPRRQDVISITTRPMRSTDATDLHTISTHPAVARGTLQMPSMELTAVQQRTDEQRPGLFRYTAVAQHEDGTRRIVGSATLHQSQNPRLRHVAGVGISVHPDYWGIGVGSHLMKALLDLADNWLPLHRVELEVYTDNPAAVRLYERLGFVIEGTKRLQSFGDGRWADAYFMARLHPDSRS
jgi:putative acetyltransferase